MIPFLVSVWLWRYRKAYSESWQSVCDKKLLPYILGNNQGKNGSISSLILIFTGILCILAMAGPTWSKFPQPVFREQSALVIALDLSRSMDAADVKPSRLARARLKIIDILKKRNEGQTALITFAEEAFTVSPLTEDSKTIESMVNSLSTDLMPSQGSNPEQAIIKAEEIFIQAGVNNGDILLLTDGIPENTSIDDVLPTQSNFRLSVLGIGTEDGAPIPVKNGSFLKDRKGAIVVPKLDENKLRRLAAQGGGRYSRLLIDDRDINHVVPEIVRNSKNINMEDIDQLHQSTDIWNEEGPWLLLLVIPIAALAFRRGIIVIFIVIFLPIPTPSYAFEWKDLWSNADQRAARSFENGQLEKAASQFENTEWQAAAYYKNEEYEKALENLQDTNSSDGFYNKGNALAKLGNLQEAIQAYDEALKIFPDNEDAKFNKKLLEDLIQKQEQNQNQNQDNNQQSDEKDSEGQDDKQQQSEQDSDKQNQQGEQESQGNNSNESSDRQEEDKNSQQNSESDEKQDEENQEENKAMKQKENQKEQAEKENEQQQADISSEQQQKVEMLKANEQWLRRIPDDPGGLLRRKFRYQSKIRGNSATKEQSQW